MYTNITQYIAIWEFSDCAKVVSTDSYVNSYDESVVFVVSLLRELWDLGIWDLSK